MTTYALSATRRAATYLTRLDIVPNALSISLSHTSYIRSMLRILHGVYNFSMNSDHELSAATQQGATTHKPAMTMFAPRAVVEMFAPAENVPAPSSFSNQATRSAGKIQQALSVPRSSNGGS